MKDLAKLCAAILLVYVVFFAGIMVVACGLFLGASVIAWQPIYPDWLLIRINLVLAAGMAIWFFLDSDDNGQIYFKRIWKLIKSDDQKSPEAV